MQNTTLAKLKTDDIVNILLKKYFERVTEFLPPKYQTKKDRPITEYQQQIKIWVDDVLLDTSLPEVPLESPEAEKEFQVIAIQVSSLMFEAYYC